LAETIVFTDVSADFVFKKSYLIKAAAADRNNFNAQQLLCLPPFYPLKKVENIFPGFAIFCISLPNFFTAAINKAAYL
jgi:hypothetical protein